MWSPAPTIPTSAPAIPATEGGWTPVIVRSAHGMELAVATDHGLLRLSSTSSNLINL